MAQVGVDQEVEAVLGAAATDLLERVRHGVAHGKHFVGESAAAVDEALQDVVPDADSGEQLREPNETLDG